MQPLTNKQMKRAERQRQKDLRRRQRQEAEYRKARRRAQPPMPDIRPVLDLARHHRATARQLAMMAVVGAVLDMPRKDGSP